MRSVPDGFLIQVLINIFYSIYIFINSVAIFLLVPSGWWLPKRNGGGGGGEGRGRKGGRWILIYPMHWCYVVLPICLFYYFFLTAVVQRPKTLPSGPKPYKRGLMILLTPFVFSMCYFLQIREAGNHSISRGWMKLRFLKNGTSDQTVVLDVLLL